MTFRSLFAVLFAASAVLASPTHWHSKRAFSVYSSCTKSNEIALTFDDGPYIYLRQISDAFTNAGAKATFFFNGNNYDCIYDSDRISDIQYAYKAGHMLGSHTWAHADLDTLSSTQIVDAMYRVEEALSRIVGVLPGFMRPPYGDYTPDVQSIAFQRNQNVAMWDWDTGDADGNTTAQSEALYNQIANAHLSNAIVLQHEPEETTATTLVPYAINLFQSQGYKLVTMAECVGAEPYAAIGVPQQQSSSWTCDGTPAPGTGCGGSIPCKSGTPTLLTSSGGSTSTSTSTTTTTTSSTSTTSTSSTSSTSTSSTSSTSTSSTSSTSTSSTSSTSTSSTSSTSTSSISTTSTTSTTTSTSTTSSTTSTSFTSSTTSTSSTSSSTTTSTSTSPTSTTSTSSSQPTQTGQVIHPNGNTGECLSAASNADGAEVEIETCSGASSQSWTVIGSTIQIYGNKCLDVTNGNAANGNKMQIWTCSTNNPNQQWSISSGAIQWSGKSFCLDNTGGVMTSGNPTQIWTCSGGPNQQWQITNPGSTSSSGGSTSSEHVIHPGASSTTCLDAAKNADGTPVVVKPCSGASSQSWTLVGSTLVIYGDKCLDVTNGSTANGNKMQIWTCSSGNPNQEFSITADNRIAWTNHGECLDLTDGSLATGNPAQMWACTDNNNNQVWNIV